MAQPDFELNWFDSTRPSYQYLCGSNSGRDCSDYHYLIIYQTFDSNYSFDSSIHPTLSFNVNSYSNNSVSLYAFDSPIIFPISDNVFSLQYNSQYEVSAYTALGVSIKMVLTENNPFSSDSPSGSITLTENGTYDVTNYAEAVVDVPPIYGDYHDDLVAIKDAIFIGAATLLVIYFFYCIYRLILKPLRS